MKKGTVLFFITFLLLVVVWVAYTFYKAYEPRPTVLQGEIDAQSYAISSKLPGRIYKVYVKKGEKVEVGDMIFSISSPEVQAKAAQAKAAKDAAEAKKEQADNGARKQEIQAAYNQWQKAKAAEKLLEITNKRIEKLYGEGVVSEQKRDEVLTKYKAAKYTAESAKEIYIMAKEGARVEIKKAADAQTRVYAAKLQEVNTYLKEEKAYSFHKGEVSEILIHAGELTPSGFPVVSIIDMDDAWAKFAVREDYLKKFQEGKVFQLKIPALGEGLYRFRVIHIGVMGEFATWKATESGKGFDMKTFEVQLTPVDNIKGLRVGMSVLLEM